MRKAGKDGLTVEKLKSVLSYSKETGFFTWIVKTGKIRSGAIAGAKHNQGYIQITVFGFNYLAHRLAWLYETGDWPKHDIDHANGNRSDNRFLNIREASRSENMQNILTPKKNTSGLIGAHKCTSSKGWFSRISSNKKIIHLGTFKTKEEAHAAYVKAKREIHKFNPEQREEGRKAA